MCRRSWPRPPFLRNAAKRNRQPRLTPTSCADCPDFAPAQKRLATLYAQDPSTIAAAYDLATKARKTLPDDPELSELLGRLSYEKRNIRAPSNCFRKAPGNGRLTPNSLFYLGMSQLQARQNAEARGALNQALAAGLQEPLAAEAKRALADLQRE